MKRISHLAGVSVFLVALTSLALGQQNNKVWQEGGNWVQEASGNLGSARNLHVKLTMGSVHVQGGSQSGISYVIHNKAYTSSEERAHREFDNFKISSYVKGDTAYIIADWQGHAHNNRCNGEFVINVPRNLDLANVETDGGDVMVAGIAGRAEIRSGGGSLHVDDIAGSVFAQTGGGSIEAGTMGGDVSLHTGGGKIKIGSAKGKITAESGGGSVYVISALQGATLQTGAGKIQVDKCQGMVKASTGGGSVELGDIGGPAEIDTGAGSIHLASAKGPVRAETGGGSIELNGVPSAQAETGAGGIIAKFLAGKGATDSSLETSAGDITVYLANDVPISIRAAIELASGHRITSDFTDIHISSEGGDWGPKTFTAEGKLNGGGPVLKVRTNTGNINFRRVSQ
ncbi:MAG TPA: DUF4097 family beta strand repeat-containing protein [Terriglobales bacterium]